MGLVLASVQKAREAGDIPADVHEVAAAAPEAAAARHLEGESVWVRPGGASAQLRTWRWTGTSVLLLAFPSGKTAAPLQTRALLPFPRLRRLMFYRPFDSTFTHFSFVFLCFSASWFSPCSPTGCEELHRIHRETRSRGRNLQTLRNFLQHSETQVWRIRRLALDLAALWVSIIIDCNTVIRLSASALDLHCVAHLTWPSCCA